MICCGGDRRCSRTSGNEDRFDELREKNLRTGRILNTVGTLTAFQLVSQARLFFVQVAGAVGSGGKRSEPGDLSQHFVTQWNAINCNK